MTKKRHPVEQIICILREADGGQGAEEVYRNQQHQCSDILTAGATNTGEWN